MNYQPDTDSKDNFPGNASQDFAKQRDMFYDLVKKWNEHERGGSHLMQDFYAPAVSRMLCLQTHPVNMMHFAELFQEQVGLVSDHKAATGYYWSASVRGGEEKYLYLCLTFQLRHRCWCERLI